MSVAVFANTFVVVLHHRNCTASACLLTRSRRLVCSCFKLQKKLELHAGAYTKIKQKACPALTSASKLSNLIGNTLALEPADRTAAISSCCAYDWTVSELIFTFGCCSRTSLQVLRGSWLQATVGCGITRSGCCRKYVRFDRPACKPVNSIQHCWLHCAWHRGSKLPITLWKDADAGWQGDRISGL